MNLSKGVDVSMYDSGSSLRTGGTFLVGLMIGGLAAAGAMLFLAPMSGKKLRSRVMDMGIGLSEQAFDKAEDVQKNARKLWRKQNKKVLSQARQYQDRAFDRIDEMRGTSKKIVDTRRKGLNGLVLRGRRAMDCIQSQGLM